MGKNRLRNILWLAKLFNMTVKNTLGSDFFKILKKYFPTTNNKIFNKNTVKLIYNCVPNVVININIINKAKLIIKQKK